MYLATSSPNGYRNYVNQDQDKNINKNIQVCAGEFSGADSSYHQYKSNCYSLMSDKCSKNWDESCTSYVNNSNDQEAKLFLQNVKGNPSKITIHPSNQMQPSHQDQYNQYHQYHQDQYQYNQYQYQHNNPYQIRQSRQQPYQDQYQTQQHQQLQHIMQVQRPTVIKNTFIQQDIQEQKDVQEINNERFLQEQKNNERLIQERTLQERLLQEKMNNERLLQEKINNEKLLQEKLLKEKMNNERLIQEKIDNERLIQEKQQQDEANQKQIVLIEQELKKQAQEEQVKEEEMKKNDEIVAKEYQAEQDRLVQSQISQETTILQLEQNKMEEDRLNHMKEEVYKEQTDDFYTFITKDNQPCQRSCDVSNLL